MPHDTYEELDSTDLVDATEEGSAVLSPENAAVSRDQFVCQNLHLVYSVARRFSGMGESLEDLIQEGAIGLMNAVDQFDSTRGAKFSTYACHLIASQIQHYLRDRGRLIRQPAWVQELNSKITRATEQLTQALGREPTPDEIADRLQIALASVHNVLAARELNRVFSLSTPSESGDESEGSVVDQEKLRTAVMEDLALTVEDRIVLEEAIAGLKELEQKVVRLFFFDDLNQSEIARKLGISVNYSSYLLRRGTTKIKALLEEQRVLEVPPTPAAAMTRHDDMPIIDPLTGVYSGAYLRLRVSEEIARSQRYPTNFALMIVGAPGMADDPFLAQPLLLAIGARLKTQTRVVDLIAYLGEGLFGLLLPHTGREARILGERLRHCPGVPTPGGSELGVTLAVGFVVFPLDGADGETLLQRAQTVWTAASQQSG
jgi:RNA polymerase sigma-B factor